MTRAVLGRLQRPLDDAPPQTIAASVALGLTLGVFPLYGAPTLLCVGAAIVFRPHVPLLQAINLAISPLQLALALQFQRIGARLLPNLAGAGHLRGRLLAVAAQMIVGWLLISIPGGAVAYVIATRTLLRWRRSFALHAMREAQFGQTAAAEALRRSRYSKSFRAAHERSTPPREEGGGGSGGASNSVS